MSSMFSTIKHSAEKEVVWLKQQFQLKIAPLYGDQQDSLTKIFGAKDRVCDIMQNENGPLGVVVYKAFSSNEFRGHGIANSIEIKTLFLADSQNQSGKGYGTALLNRVIDYARSKRISSLHVTVNAKKEDSLAFFKHKGFKVAHLWVDKYISGDREYLLVLNLDPREFRVTLKEPYLSYIREKKKTVEGRLNVGVFKSVKPGDVVVFFNHRREIRVVVEYVHKYDDFRSMLRNEGVSGMLPDISSVEEAVRIYRSFRGYAEKEISFGVVAIGMSITNVPVIERKLSMVKIAPVKRLRDEAQAWERNTRCNY
jgi:ASC-1-like (ASCH) protein/GNAT superfamily N-acetyltransferase